MHNSLEHNQSHPKKKDDNEESFLLPETALWKLQTSSLPGGNTENKWDETDKFFCSKKFQENPDPGTKISDKT